MGSQGGHCADRTQDQTLDLRVRSVMEQWRGLGLVDQTLARGSDLTHSLWVRSTMMYGDVAVKLMARSDSKDQTRP